MPEIGLFGGSFNPPHNSHVITLEEVCRKKFFDEIWVIPQGHHRLKGSSDKISHILNMCRKIFPNKIGKTKLRLCFYDVGNTFKGSTYKLVKFIKHRYPEHNFHIIIGSDCASEIHLWDQWEKLLKENKVVILHRKGIHCSWMVYKHWVENKPLIIIPRSENAFSSSDFRKALANVPKDVLKYIFENKLYIED